MGKDGPALVPEWYEGAKGGPASNAISDGNVVESSLGKRLPLNPGYRDSRSLLSEGSSKSGSSAFSSFGRRDRKLILDPREKDRALLYDIGSSKHRIGANSSWRSHSGDVWTKGSESSSKSVDLSRGILNSGSIRASSLKKDFPLLGAKEKKGILPNPITTGDDARWKSVLGEAPAVLGGNGSTVDTEISARVTTTSKLPIDTYLADELTVRQCKQLIPKTSLVPKFSGLNVSEKAKFTGDTRSGDFIGPPKRNQQLSSQLRVVNNALRASARPDFYKEPQFGNLQVLNRENVGIVSSSTKEIDNQDASLKTLNLPINPNLKAELTRTSKLSPISSEVKKPLSLAKRRNDFFNSLRKKTAVNISENLVPVDEKTSEVERQNQEEKGGDVMPANVSVICQKEGNGDSEDNCSDGGDAFVDDKLSQSAESDGEDKHKLCYSESNYHQADADDEQEKAFLRSLGWDESAGEEFLTPEEISAFLSKYEKLKPCSKFFHRVEADSLSVTQTS